MMIAKRILAATAVAALLAPATAHGAYDTDSLRGRRSPPSSPPVFPDKAGTEAPVTGLSARDARSQGKL